MAQTANQGSNKIVLLEAVDWQVGEQIVVTTTSYIPSQNEISTISWISADRKTLILDSAFVFDHLSFEETFSNGVYYRIAAAVGLLSRNIKVIGGSYPNQDSDLYGFRIIVSDYSTMVNGINTYYKGYARISDVEFNRAGQYSRDTGDDSKFGILFSNLGDYNVSRPSYVRNSAFNFCYFTAVSIYGSNSIPIENNVIYRTLDWSLLIAGSGNLIRKNLVINNVWSPSILTYLARIDKFWNGAIDVTGADSIILEDNFVVGAERIAINFFGDYCSSNQSLSKNSVTGNKIYASLVGAVIRVDTNIPSTKCIKISGFTIYKTAHYGIYYKNVAYKLMISNNILIENKINIIAFTLAPASLTHAAANKQNIIQNNLIIGQTKFFNCTTDVKPTSLFATEATVLNTYGAGFTGTGKIGVVWSNFQDGSNGMPKKPWYDFIIFNFNFNK